MTANVLRTTSKIADYALMKFGESCRFLKTINREYDKEFAKKGGKIGDKLDVPYPQHAKYRKGLVMETDPLQTLTREVKVFGVRGFDLTYNAAEWALDIEEFGPRYLDQRIADLAINIEAEVLGMAIATVPNQTADPATAFNKVGFANVAKKQIEDNGGHTGAKQLLLNSAGQIQIIDSLKGLFNSQAQVAKQYEDGEMGKASGFSWHDTTVMPRQLRGAGNGAYLSNGVAQAGAAVVVDTGAGTIFKGEIVTFAGVNAVHPQTKQDLGYLRQFCVTADYAGGAGSLAVYPAVTPTGTEQNVTQAVPDNVAMTILGTANTPYGINLAYTKDAFTFGTVDMPELPGLEMSRRNFDGIAMSVSTDSNIKDMQCYMRVDVMCAFGALRPEWASRIANNDTLLTPA
jgi:hypothetical protein